MSQPDSPIRASSRSDDAVPRASERSRSPTTHSRDRSVTNARLASPIPSLRTRSSSMAERRGSDAHHGGHPNGTHSPLAGLPESTVAGSSESALASALSASLGKHQQPVIDEPHAADSSEVIAHGTASRRHQASNYGSFAQHSTHHSGAANSPAPYEDFDIVQRHLVGQAHGDVESGRDKGSPAVRASGGPVLDEDEGEFSSLRLQGGDITRQIYRRTEAEQNAKHPGHQRRNTYHALRPEPESEELDIDNIRQPGGFRRNHLMRKAVSPTRQSEPGTPGRVSLQIRKPNLVTKNFFEFLSLYGHFAGEDADDDDDEDEPHSHSGSPRHDDYDRIAREDETAGEHSPLLAKVLRRRNRQERPSADKKGAAGTVLILLKSFVGTGVLFLPRAFLNGGMLFSFVTLLVVACVSYYCFVLLTTSRLALKGSYAEMGEMTYGKWLRRLINFSLVISQMGFASAYIVFTSENLQAFILAVSDCKTLIDIKLMILMQLIVFMPLSLYRNLNNIAYVVYIADLFIVLGLVYLYYFGIATIASKGIADIVLFNKNTWTLFIGTAIFTFEGIGLIIPIQDGMKKPEQFPVTLGGVMVIITTIFTTMGAIAYGAFGSKTETVIILNMPQDNKFVNGVQFLYSLAILLSTPMQIFPAITIMEKGVFSRSGKHNRNVKWMKNIFRFGVVMLSALIAWVGANDLDKFVALVGSFACIPLVYIYPPLIHSRGVRGASRWQTHLDKVLCGLGFVLMAYTSITTVYSWVGGASPGGPNKHGGGAALMSRDCRPRGARP